MQKQHYIYKIMGLSVSGKEELDTAPSRMEADRLVDEYRLAFGTGWSIWCKRARQEWYLTGC